MTSHEESVQPHIPERHAAQCDDLCAKLMAALAGVVPDRPVSTRIRLRKLVPALRVQRKKYTDHALINVLEGIGIKISPATLRKLLSRRNRRNREYTKSASVPPQSAGAQG